MINHNDIFLPILAFGGGLALGAVFYLGLSWTVTRGLAAQRSALWFPASLLLRMTVTLAGFHVIGAGHWERLVACLLGFLAAQILVTRFAPSAAARSRPGRSTPYAS